MRPVGNRGDTSHSLGGWETALVLSAVAEGQPQLKQAANNLLGLSFRG